MTIVITYEHRYTINRFLKFWAIALRGKVRFIYYSDLAFRKTLPRDVTIFTDLERVSPAQLELAAEAAGQLRAAGVRVLNEPSRVLCRYDLLRALKADGINNFNVYRTSDDRSALKFPAFVRRENEHQGSLTPLLNTAQELEDALKQAIQNGLKSAELLIVEFCATADEDNLFRKYSAFVIGQRFIPRHLLFSRGWMVKDPDLKGELYVREENEYLAQKPHPHEAPLRAIFQRAGIDYGRIDYSLMNGKIQVWEINTNPNIVPASAFAPERAVSQNEARDQVCAAMQYLHDEFARSKTNGSTPAASKTIAFQVSPALQQRLGILAQDHRFRSLRQLLRPFRPVRIKGFIRSRVIYPLKMRFQ